MTGKFVVNGEHSRLNLVADSKGLAQANLARVDTLDRAFNQVPAQAEAWLDIRFAAVALGVGGAGQHGPTEYAEISTIVPYYRAMKEFLEHLRSNTDE